MEYDVDLLLEKWLLAFKKYGHMLEIFENPTRKELAEIGKTQRFILDAKRKKVYIWPATGAIHTDAWIHLKKELNDSRHVYKSGDLIAGVQESGRLLIYNTSGLSQSVRKRIKEQDWSFSKKYYPRLEEDILSQLD